MRNGLSGESDRPADVKENVHRGTVERGHCRTPPGMEASRGTGCAGLAARGPVEGAHCILYTGKAGRWPERGVSGHYRRRLRTRSREDGIPQGHRDSVSF